MLPERQYISLERISDYALNLIKNEVQTEIEQMLGNDMTRGRWSEIRRHSGINQIDAELHRRNSIAATFSQQKTLVSCKI